MKTIYQYPNDLDSAVSAIKRKARINSTTMITVHHSVKDGIPFQYWFSIWHRDTGYIDFDIREMVDLPEVLDPFDEEKWFNLSNRGRLDAVVKTIEELRDKDADVMVLIAAITDYANDGELPF